MRTLINTDSLAVPRPGKDKAALKQGTHRLLSFSSPPPNIGSLPDTAQFTSDSEWPSFCIIKESTSSFTYWYLGHAISTTSTFRAFLLFEPSGRCLLISRNQERYHLAEVLFTCLRYMWEVGTAVSVLHSGVWVNNGAQQFPLSSTSPIVAEVPMNK